MEEFNNMRIQKLTEDIEPTEAELIDPSDSAEEIAQDAIDQVEAGSEGDETLSSAGAKAIADEVIKTGDDIGAGAAVIIPKVIDSDNQITRLLQEAFDLAIENREMGLKENCNILLIGLPGSAKTASVKNWAENLSAKGTPINLVPINAKNNDLEAYINGFTGRDQDNPNRVRQLYSSGLAALDKENSVLFLDEFNRQVKPHIRASLLTLINEHEIGGEDKDANGESTGVHKFNNLLFTIACINPSVPTDKGAAPLNDAELSRFAAILDGLDSDPASATDFWTKRFNMLIATMPTNHPKYAKFLEMYLRMQDLGLFIFTHDDFSFDTRADLDDLSMQQKKMLNQRSLGEIITWSRGDVEKFKMFIEARSHFLDKDKDMLLGIANEYIVPSFEDLCRQKGIDPANIQAASSAIINSKKAHAAESEEETFEEPLEDDEDFFGNLGVNTQGIVAKSPVEVVDAIKKAAAQW